MQKGNKLYLGDCLNVLPEIETDSIDAIVTDPPYGISFMGKDWDKAVPSIAIWQECLRVLKPGAFAFVMCIPRQDCLAYMICRLEDAGFNIAFSSIYWTYATGFPKAQNISKKIDQKVGIKREVIGVESCIPTRPITKNWEVSNKLPNGKGPFDSTSGCLREITVSSTPQAKALDGAYSGFQPKPAVEIVIVAIKPLSEKSYINQALKNGHGATWLDDCRIPFEENDFLKAVQKNDSFKNGKRDKELFGEGNKIPHSKINNNGRFPANILCEDDVLNDGTERKSGGREGKRNITWGDSFINTNKPPSIVTPCTKDKGSFSRYFSLDAWFAERIKLLPKEAQKTFPWLIVPKAAKAEKYQNLDIVPEPSKRPSGIAYNKHSAIHSERKGIFHPTIKPIKLMSWLITLASREGDIILDPFCGSGTTLIAAKMLSREYIGIELEKEYYDIARLRIDETQQNIDKFL